MTERGRRLIAMTTRGAVLVGLLALGFGGFWWLWWMQPEPQRRGPVRDEPQVVVFEAQRVPVSRQWYGYGTARARDAANVPARVTATVERIPDEIEPGYRVERGQLLMELDASDFREELDAAEQRIAELEAQLARLDVQQESLRQRLELEREDVETARRELDRAQELARSDVATQQDVDRARRELIVAQRARLSTSEALDQIPAQRRSLEAQRAGQRAIASQARLNVERTRISSPLDGVLEAVDVEPGENVAGGSRVARVVSLRRIEVPVRLPASARLGMGVGDPVEMRAADGSERRWWARVSRIAPIDDDRTRTVTVYVELHQSEGTQPNYSGAELLTPGMFIEAVVNSQHTQRRWVVPRRAIREGAIRLVDEVRVVSRAVRIAWAFEGRVPALGLEDERQWAVLVDDEALTPGRLVLVSAADGVLDGERVEPVVVEAEE